MKAKDIMTQDPVCCTPQTTLREVAQMMRECDCGEIPVVETQSNLKPVGVITDRDIACRAVAEGVDPDTARAGEYMTSPCITVHPEAGLEECCQVMEENQVRRVPVVNENGRCCGIVSQADIARNAPPEETATVVNKVSQQTGAAV